MKNLRALFRGPSFKIPKLLPISFLAVSFLGFLDAVYLVAEHYFGVPLNCSVFRGCEQVLTSQYATIGPIPVALLGAIYYLAIFLLTVLYLDTKRVSIITFAAWITPIGFLASLWLLYIQIFVIGAICQYCIISMISSATLFAFGLIIIKLGDKIGK